MTLEEELVERAAKNMSDDIDFEVISALLCDTGWTKVILQPMTTEQSQEVDQWIDRCKGQVHTRGLVFVFEDARDATWCILKWKTK